MDVLPIALPSAPPEPRRPPVPIVAALVPVAAGVVLWLVTGSLFALCFAALGPLMILASLVDGARSRRRESRRSAQECERGWEAAEAELVRRQEEERELRWHRHPDAAASLLDPPLRGGDAVDALTEIVIGAGSAPSGIRVAGGDGERARSFQERSSVLTHAPIGVPLGGGVCVRAPAPIAAAVIRALVVQLCLRFGAAQLGIAGESLAELGVDGLPHARVRRRSGFRLGVARAGEPRPDADAVLWALDADAPVPEGITTVLDLIEPRRAVLRTPHGVAEVSAECVSAAQARGIAAARASLGEHADVLPELVGMRELEQRAGEHGLPAAIGRGERGDVVVDLVEDGPHAIVTGITGTGKSELLVSWVSAIASAHGPERVSFVLADFKGGTAFEPLRDLPQVVAVITDLDDAGARRGVSSLTSELRRREAVLASAGVRDVRDAGLPRLVIVVDEFAALLQEHPELGAVFTDVAARGRALGMHLILGTQRAAGVVKDALAANCPLRLSLRVQEAADSRLVIGTDAAAELPGGPVSRGLGLVRRPQDTEPLLTRVALTSAADLRTIARRWADASRQRSPWLPQLPRVLPLAELAGAGDAPVDAVLLGRADAPEHQQQPLELLRVGEDRGLALLGAPGSGRTSVLRLLAAQHEAQWVPRDPEGAWDAVAALAGSGPSGPALVLCDDLDAQLADLPPDYAQQLAQRWEQILRGARGTTFVLSAARAAGPVARILDGLPRRALLRMPSRLEHLAAGGESDGYVRDRVPGRARIGDREVQFAWVPETDASRPGGVPQEPADSTGTPEWMPGRALTGVVTTGVRACAERLRSAHPGLLVVAASPEAAHAADMDRAIVVGDADTWQRSWPLWQRIRSEGEILVRAECPVELRQLAGVRDLPPFALPHAGRAWSLQDGDPPRRVIVPALRPR